MVDGDDDTTVQNLSLSMKDFESKNTETFKEYAERMIGDNEAGKQSLK